MGRNPFSQARGGRPSRRREPRKVPFRRRAPPGTDDYKARYDALVESLPLVTYVGILDVQGSFVYISPQVEKLLGFPPGDWLAKPRLWLERLHPRDRRSVLPALTRAHRDERPFRAEYRLLDRKGRVRWVRDESRVVRDDRGEAMFVQGTWTDITAARELERQSAGKGTELRSSQAQLEEFVSTASHELTAPLRRIANLGELLARRAGERLDEQSLGLLERIRESAARLQRLVAGMVAYQEQGRSRAPNEEVDLEAVFGQALHELARPLRASGADVSRGPLPRVVADSSLVERVFISLLDNAIKFSGGRRPQVRVWAERSGSDWIVAVRDSGIGLSLREAARVFVLFDPGQPRRSAEGLRLGLPLCRKIIESLGGRIWVESEPGEGATFRFTLPAPPPPPA